MARNLCLLNGMFCFSSISDLRYTFRPTWEVFIAMHQTELVCTKSLWRRAHVFVLLAAFRLSLTLKFIWFSASFCVISLLFLLSHSI